MGSSGSVAQFSDDFSDTVTFTVLNGVGSFSTVRESCIDLSTGRSSDVDVASFSSVEEFQFILDLIESVEDPVSTNFYVGLTKGSRDASDAKNFEFVDGTNNNFSNESFVFPWSSNQPNDFNSNQNCVVIGTDGIDAEIGTLNDVDCTVEASVICKQVTETPTPTLAPTLTNTLAPTLAPTLTNTLAPTLAPTLTNTLTPTSSPTLRDVSLVPTDSPVGLVADRFSKKLFSLEQVAFGSGAVVLFFLVCFALQKHRKLSARYAILKEYKRKSMAFEKNASTFTQPQLLIL